MEKIDRACRIELLREHGMLFKPRDSPGFFSKDKNCATNVLSDKICDQLWLTCEW